MTDSGQKASREFKALWFTSSRTAELQREEISPPGRGQVQIRATASAISGGTEMLVYRGEVPAGLPLDLPTLEGSFGFPIKYGYATVGVVEESGPGVETPTPGDPVFVHHPHQQAFNVSADMPALLPSGLDPTLGTFAANVETALNIVHDTPLRLGETGIVFGQGVVGLLVTQLLGMSGARVLAVDPIESRRSLAHSFGADEALELGEDLRREVLEHTGGRGADFAVEVSGSGDALQDAIDCVADEGTVVVASWYGTKRIGLALGENFHRGRLKLRSSQVGRLNPESAPRWDHRRRMEAVMDLLPKLELEALISDRIPFENVPDAYKLLDESPEETLQVILIYTESRTENV